MLLGVALGGCTQVRLVQREGCWVRQTERWPKQITEDIGPCKREVPSWVDDRLTRLVQECVAQSDYRWQMRALDAWNRRQPLPEREPDESVINACVSQAAQSVVAENDALKVRVGDLDNDRTLLRETNGQFATALGEAAQKPAGSAVATASARGDGSSTSTHDSKSETSHASEVRTSTTAPSSLNAQQNQRPANPPPPAPKPPVQHKPVTQPAPEPDEPDLVGPPVTPARAVADPSRSTPADCVPSPASP